MSSEILSSSAARNRFVFKPEQGNTDSSTGHESLIQFTNGIVVTIMELRNSSRLQSKQLQKVLNDLRCGGVLIAGHKKVLSGTKRCGFVYSAVKLLSLSAVYMFSLVFA